MRIQVQDSQSSVLGDSDRPTTFLLSTTRWASDLRKNLGSADYSYGFVMKAFQPLLDRLGRSVLVDRPESSLIHAAYQARERGERPVHLAFHPPHNVYLTPAVPTILVPAWEFPQLPDRDLALDPRTNWKRICSRVDRIATHTEFSAAAFRRAGLACDVDVVPVPIADRDFEVPDYDPRFSFTLECRHMSWPDTPAPAGPGAGPAPAPARPGIARRAKGKLKGFYWRTAGALLNDHANAMLRSKLLGTPVRPLPPSGPVTLSGLVYTTILNLADRRKNIQDLLTAYLMAFRDRPDVTLVIKLVTNPLLEGSETQELQALHQTFGIRHACRVVVISEYLTAEQMRDLQRVTTYYVNASRAEGTCLPLVHALAAGRPAIAPCHTGMADYMDDDLGFVVRSSPEPAYWPQDPARQHTTTWHRMVWSDLRDHFLESARIHDHDRARYDAMARAAREQMREYASEEVVLDRLRDVLRDLPREASDALDWHA